MSKYPQNTCFSRSSMGQPLANTEKNGWVVGKGVNSSIVQYSGWEKEREQAQVKQYPQLCFFDSCNSLCSWNHIHLQFCGFLAMR